MEHSAFIWRLPRAGAERTKLAKRLRKHDCETVYVKAGGDGGFAWIDSDVGTASWVNPQWSDWLGELKDAGLQVYPWFYPHPFNEREHEAIVRALEVNQADVIVLNPETEWRQPNQANNAYAEEWVESLRTRLIAEFGAAPRIGFTSVPTWRDFPYEGFCAACDGPIMPQHYWRPGVADQMRASNSRTPADKTVVPILTASKEFDDAGVLSLAVYAVETCDQLGGFSSWEAGNGSYQIEVVQRAYALLPASLTPKRHTAPLPMDRRNFTETGFGIEAGFRDRWEALEDVAGTSFALAEYGYPVSNEVLVTLAQGVERPMQLFERGAMVYDAMGGAPWDVTRATQHQYLAALRAVGVL